MKSSHRPGPATRCQIDPGQRAYPLASQPHPNPDPMFPPNHRCRFVHHRAQKSHHGHGSAHQTTGPPCHRRLAAWHRHGSDCPDSWRWPWHGRSRDPCLPHHHLTTLCPRPSHQKLESAPPAQAHDGLWPRCDLHFVQAPPPHPTRHRAATPPGPCPPTARWCRAGFPGFALAPRRCC